MAQPMKVFLACIFLSFSAFSAEFFSPYQSGEGINSVIEKIKSDPLLKYQENQVTMAIPVIKGNEILFEIDDKVRALSVKGTGDYLKRVFFHFRDEKLVSMTVVFSPRFSSYYEVFLKLKGKYGDVSVLKGPQIIEWESGGALIRLERPMAVKYMDLAIVEEIKKQNEEDRYNDFSIKEAVLDRL